MAKLIFKDAEAARDAIMASQKKEIEALYKQWADEIGKRAEYYAHKTTASSVVSEAQMRELKKMLEASSAHVSQEIQGIITDNIYTVADAVVQCNTAWMSQFGFSEHGLNAAFNHVPDQVVKRLITGQIYEGGWNLSKRIWSDNQDTMRDAYRIVAKGMAENKPIYAIAKELQQYVTPGAAKPWNPVLAMKNTQTGKIEYKRIYKGQVDYNAQRLARTLVQHGYQQSFIATTGKNPFVTKYIWHSNGSRPCPLCQDRDGQEFAKGDLPMDHPNGQCVMEPVIADDMVDQLADWFNSPDGTYPDIDEFAKNFGYDATRVRTNVEVGSGRTAVLPRIKDYIGKPFRFEDVPDYVKGCGEDAYNKSVQTLARKYKMSTEDVQARLDRAFSSMVDASDFGMHITSDNLMNALQDGRFKNQHESGASGGYFGPQLRLRKENQMFNVPMVNGAGMSDADRPIYGLLMPKYDGSDMVKDYYTNGPGSWYGDGVTVIFKRGNVINQATLTVGDSFDYSSKIRATLAANPTCAGSFDYKKVNTALMQVDTTNNRSVVEGMVQITSGERNKRKNQYIEVQLHGKESHSIDGIDRVLLSRSESSRYADLISMLDEKKIPYDWI